MTPLCHRCRRLIQSVPDLTLGALVRAARRRRGLDQRELARLLALAPLQLRKLERDELAPTPELVARLRDLLELPALPAGQPVLDPAATSWRVETPEEGLDTSLLPAAGTAVVGPPAPATTGGAVWEAALRRRGYVLEQQIGEGGFGSVWRATQLSVGRAVAIKVVRPELADDIDFIRRFEQEARLVARLEHPHIVPLYDFWRAPGMAFMVMRWLRGGALSARLALGDAAELPPLNLLALLHQVGQALHVAHQAGVVHRDLKPANILLDETGNACLADFGIARQLGSDGSGTQVGEIVGSVAYCAPEQLRGEAVSARTDVYAFGLLCFELVCGRRPFHGTGSAALIHQHLHVPPPSAREFVPDLPSGLDAAIAHALQKDAAQRPRDVLQLLEAIDAAVRAGLESGWAGRVAYGHSLTLGTGHSSAPTHLAFRDLDNPYLGLAAFGEGDAGNFFGRESLIEQLLGKLAGHGPLDRALFVVGASGSGKSSLVRAGLLPALRADALPGSGRWLIADLRPGTDPLGALAQALSRVSVRAGLDLDGLLRSDVHGFSRAIDRCLPAAEGCELLLLVDQFEELFTLTADEALRAAFIDAVTTALLDPHSQLRMVFTLRADFLDRPLKYPDLGALLGERSVLVPAMSLDELERAIVGPARRLGLRFEDGLVAAILEEAGHQAGALPLLQYALSELFLKRDRGVLTLAAFRAAGGIRGALAGRAQATWAALDPLAQGAAQQLFLRLTTLGEGSEDTRRRVLDDELDTLAMTPDDHAALARALAGFSAARLLTFDRDGASGQRTVEVAHEALLRSWSQLRDWLSAARGELRQQRQLAAAAEQWRAAAEDPSFLLAGTRLHALQALASGQHVVLSQQEQRFLAASLDASARREALERERSARELEQARTLAAQQAAAADNERRGNRRLRWLVAGLALVLLGSLWLGWQLKSRGDALAAATTRANQEAQSARSLSDFWARLFATADPNLSQGQGAELKVVDVLASGLAQVPQALRDSPLAQSRLLLALGKSFRQLASYPQAQQALAQAAAAQAESVDAAIEERIELKLEQGRLLADLGQPAEALAVLEAAQRLQVESAAAPLSRATTLNIIASIHNEGSRFGAAEPLLRESLALRRAHGAAASELSVTLNNLAFALLRLGAADEARTLFEEGLALRQQLHPEPNLDAAILRMNIGVAQRDLGAFAAAVADLSQARAALETLLGADKPHPVLAALTQHEAQLAVLSGDPAQAQAHIERAVAMLTAVNGGNVEAPTMLGVRRDRAQLAVRRGDAHAARSDHTFVCALLRARNGETGLDWARCQLREAELLELEEQPAAAVVVLGQAIPLFARREPSDRRAAIDLARALVLRARLRPEGAAADLRQARELLNTAQILVAARQLLEALPR